MSYLAELVARVMEPVGGLRPRVPSLYEPVEDPVAEVERPPEGAAITARGPRASVAAAPAAAEDRASDTPEVVDPFRPPAAAPAARRSRPGPTGGNDDPVDDRVGDPVDDPVLSRSGAAQAERVAVRVPGAAAGRSFQATPEPSRRAAAVPARRGVVRRAAGPPAPEPEPLAEPASAAARRPVERGGIAAAPADVRAIAAAAPRAARGFARQRAAETADEPTAVRVTIGRIDVRSVEPPLVAPEPAPPAGPEPLRLEDYLRQRDAGER